MADGDDLFCEYITVEIAVRQADVRLLIFLGTGYTKGMKLVSCNHAIHH